MCEICRRYPCHPRCPNAPDPRPVAYCLRCNEPLYAGDEHFEGICKECLDGMTTSEWLELFGERMEEMKED